MFKAVWLNEYTKTNSPKDAKHNNTMSGIHEIETAYTHINTTFVLDAEEKHRIQKWMDEFRKA